MPKLSSNLDTSKGKYLRRRDVAKRFRAAALLAEAGEGGLTLADALELVTQVLGLASDSTADSGAVRSKRYRDRRHAASRDASLSLFSSSDQIDQSEREKEKITCPVDLEEHAGPLLSRVALELDASPADVSFKTRSFVAFWTANGRRRHDARGWLQRLRQELHETHRRGKLVGVAPAPGAVHHEALKRERKTGSGLQMSARYRPPAPPGPSRRMSRGEVLQALETWRSGREDAPSGAIVGPGVARAVPGAAEPARGVLAGFG